MPEGYDPPVCPAQYCHNDGECLVDEANLLKCVCKKGFTGDRCQINIDECLTEGNAACAGGTCVDQVNGFYCRCSNGIGLNCQQTIENPCTSQHLQMGLQFFELPSLERNSYLHCTGELTFTVSRCAENLFWHPDERTCTVERPALKSSACFNSPCKNGGECIADGVSSAGAYGQSSANVRCLCKNGYTGVFCEEMIDFCLSSPCKNGGRCLSYAGGYTCVCPDKIIDDCCCNGVVNPCPPKQKLMPGVNNYFPHLFPTKYIHCDFDGRAFVRNCAPGTKWRQDIYSCLSENSTVESFGQAYGYSSAPAPVPAQPAQSYGQVETPLPVPALPREQPQQQYGQVQAPAVSQNNYGQQQPQLPSIPREQPQQQYGQAPQIPKIEPPRQERVDYGQQQIKIEAPREQPQQQYGQVQAPAISQNSYGQQEQPIIPSIPKEQLVQPQYGQVQAPAVSQNSYSQQQQPLPVPALPREQPVQQQYGQQIQPQLPRVEINNGYSQQQQTLPIPALPREQPIQQQYGQQIQPRIELNNGYSQQQQMPLPSFSNFQAPMQHQQEPWTQRMLKAVWKNPFY